MADLGEENKISGVFGGVEFNNDNNQNQNWSNENEQNPNWTDQNGQNGNWTNQNVNTNTDIENIENVGTIRNTNLPVKTGFWNKFKAFWLQDIDWNKEIKVELTPYQQKVENEINEFLHQEITWEKVHDFLFQEIRFRRKK